MKYRMHYSSCHKHNIIDADTEFNAACDEEAIVRAERLISEFDQSYSGLTKHTLQRLYRIDVEEEKTLIETSFEANKAQKNNESINEFFCPEGL